ncbi:hypothetical protein HYQ44_001903 [Verticillium longisporum]|nr:hypothetical protein HYQ44_001903 [Verticillium longisporum]
MSLPNTFVYMQFHPLTYIVKLNIEMIMADLIGKIARNRNCGVISEGTFNSTGCDSTLRSATSPAPWLYIGSIVYVPAAYFVEVTILLLIARVFAAEERVAKGIYIFILMLLFAYTPYKIFIADVNIAIIVDLVIVLVPISVIWSMRLPLRETLRIILMLIVGTLTIGVAVFWLVKVVMFVNSEDVTADFVVLDLTACIELSIGIVCACLPSAHCLYELYKDR